jgi:hypothetical protein
MIVCNIDEFPVVRIGFQHSTWNTTDLCEAMDSIREILLVAIEKKQRLRVIISGNQQIPDPSILIWPWFIARIVGMYSLFALSLERTAVYAPTDHMNHFFVMLLKVYTPARPLQVFSNFSEAQTWCLS